MVWHPKDTAGHQAASQLFDHFHGTSFSGLIGGAIEVYERSEGWRSKSDSPRPVPFPEDPPPNDIPAARIVAVVPVLANEFALAVESGHGAWNAFAESIVAAQEAMPSRIGIFPLLLDGGAGDGTRLGHIFRRFQRIAASSSDPIPEPAADVRCRDLAQGISQLIAGSDSRLNIFISHTKRQGAGEEGIAALISLVRSIISETRLRYFFDTNDLQPGRDFDAELRTKAASSAILALRTDLYASREWCQREMLIAKQHGMPIVILDALRVGEERGSFLMDNVPRFPARGDAGDWKRSDVRRGLNVLVDQCLKRSLWELQKELAAVRPELNIDWWPSHAPEPITLANWMRQAQNTGTMPSGLRILHPDPPLGPDEVAVLQQIAWLGGSVDSCDVMTPRMLAARGA